MDQSHTGDAAAAPAKPLAAAVPDFGELVERWWNDHFPGSAVARVTAAWNHAFTAKEELKRRLAAQVPGEGQ